VMYDHDGCLRGFAKSTLPEGHLAHNLDGLCVEDTVALWCLAYLGARWRRLATPSCRTPQGHDPARKDFQFFVFFRSMAPRPQVDHQSTCDEV